MALLIGATMNQDDLATYKTFLAGNNIMRIFPSTKTVATGKQLPVLPDWSNARFLYCQEANVIPFVSTKVDGDTDGLNFVKAQLQAMPSWITTLYITDRHEPEGDVSAATYIANFNAFLAMINSLPANIRSRIKCGPVLTKTWTEKPSGGNYNYGTYDPGGGDFFGVDMYQESGTASSVVTPSSLTAPSSFLATVKAYRKTGADTRPRIFPELGVIGMPDDLDGTARANWIIGIYNEVRTWTQASQGWPFLGFIWWHAPGKATGVVYQIGQRRDFPLHLRTVAGSAGANYEDSYAVQLVGDPPKPAAAYNAVYLAENPIVYEPGTNPPLPSAAPPAADAMRADYEILVTDRNLNVIGDPIYNWTTIDLTLRFNEPSTGQVTAPGYAWIREQLAPGNRIVCVRRVLGTANVVLAGPIESVQYERADDGENGGDGKVTFTWSDDMVWLAGRVVYPDPTKTPATQTTDYWLWNGSTESGLYALVNGNAGPGALAARRVPRLVMAPVRSLPGTVTVSATLGQARFTLVSETARDMAERGGRLGFRTYQDMVAKNIVFEVYQPRDLTQQVRFGFNLGNLKYLNYEVSMPEANTVIVGGQFNTEDVAAGADKFVMEVADTLDATTWGRVETYLPRPGNDPVADLTAEANAELADKIESSRLSSTASDTVDQRFGVHYGLGDIVSIEFWTGQALADVVRIVHIQAWPTAGEVVSTTIGTQATTYEKTVNRTLRGIDRRVGRLERNAAVKKPTTP